ncbi:hypothetical protein C0995_007535 [Termitomyces sp. Mi166|nr:hypothetical protein C0995_007535 [Termitomyces sp. Mi166\
MDLNVRPQDLPALYPLVGRKVRFETLQLHGGTPFKDPTTNAKGIPIYQAAAFTFDSTAQLHELFSVATGGKSNLYTRFGNPTVEAFERRVAVLEGGAAAVAVSSGQAAQFIALTTLARAGDNIVGRSMDHFVIKFRTFAKKFAASSLLYGGTINQFSILLERYGVTVKFAKGNDPASMESLIDDKTKAIYCETISNPRFNVPDIPAIAGVAHRYGIPLVVDNTFGACGFISRPLDLGADILVESATKVRSLLHVILLASTYSNSKWIGGHGTTIGGVIVDSGRFDWSKSTRFPAFNTVFESNGSRCGIDALVGHTYYEASALIIEFGQVLKEKSLTTKIRLEILRDLGACLSPQSAWLLIQGCKWRTEFLPLVETLSLRVERHLSNALALARYLESHPKVAWVSYPGLPSHEDHEIAKRFLKGFGCVLSFGVKGGRGDIIVDNLKLHSHLANLGDVHSLIIHPASVTHGQLTEEERLAAGVTQDMLRGKESLKKLRINAKLSTTQASMLLGLKNVERLELDSASWEVLDILPRWTEGIQRTLTSLTLSMSMDLNYHVLEMTLKHVPRLQGLHVICPNIDHTKILRLVTYTPLLGSLACVVTETAQPPESPLPTPTLVHLRHLALDVRSSFTASSSTPATLLSVLATLKAAFTSITSITLRIRELTIEAGHALMLKLVEDHAATLRRLTFVASGVEMRSISVSLEVLSMPLPMKELLAFANVLASSPTLHTLVDGDGHIAHGSRPALNIRNVRLLMQRVPTLTRIVDDKRLWSRQRDACGQLRVTLERQSVEPSVQWFMPPY